MAADPDAAWDEASFAAARREAQAGRLVAPGARIDAAQLAELLRRLPTDAGPRRLRIESIDLRDATVDGDLDLSLATVAGIADMSGAAFLGSASFASTTFQRVASCVGARFARSASFEQGRFDGGASFDDVVFEQDADFGNVRGTIVSFERTRFQVGNFVGAKLAHVDFAHACFENDAVLIAMEGEEARFSDATFASRVWAQKARLGHADFHAARFGDDANFEDARFHGRARFTNATFGGRSRFTRARSEGDVSFSGARFAVDASFDGARFDGDAILAKASFASDVSFDGARFGGHLRLDETRADGQVSFQDARFADGIDVRDALLARSARFDRARFEGIRPFGPVRVGERLVLEHAVFEAAARLEVVALSISFDRAIFRAGVDLRARWAEISARDADFVAPSLITVFTAPFVEDGQEVWEWPHDRTWKPSEPMAPGWAPRMVTLQGAKVAQLTLSGVDLRNCRFASAHGLDRMQLDRVVWPQPPDPTSRRLRFTRRQTIAEEHYWRARRRNGALWRGGDIQTPMFLPEPPEAPGAAEIAGIYRALRKGREASGDEQAAADFYYGEMEMRRRLGDPAEGIDLLRDRPVPEFERLLVWLYWLVAGYGLRASRAFASLAVTLLMLAVPLSLWGFRPDRGYGAALLFAAESSVSLLRAPEAALSASGQAMQLFLRIVGPLLFGLIVLALRSRVKR